MNLGIPVLKKSATYVNLGIRGAIIVLMPCGVNMKTL